MSIEKALADLTAALVANTAALQSSATIPLSTVNSVENPPVMGEETETTSTAKRTRKPKPTETVDKAAIYFYNETLERVVIMFPDKHPDAVARLDAAEGVKRISLAEYSKLKDAGVDKFPYQEDMSEGADWMTESIGSDDDDSDGLGGADADQEFEPTAEDVKAILIRVRDEVGKSKLAEIFKAIGVKTFPEITEEKYSQAYQVAMDALEATEV